MPNKVKKRIEEIRFFFCSALRVKKEMNFFRTALDIATAF
jgi:hypothetical protein